MRDLTGTVYVDIRNKVTIKVTGIAENNSHRYTIITVTPMGDRVRERTIGAHRLTGNYLTLNGRPRKNGYVAVDQLPPGHLFAQLPAVKHATGAVPAATPSRPELRMEDAPLYALSEDALVMLSDRVHREFEDAKKNLDDVKAETKRRAQGKGGLAIVGDIVVELYQGHQVDDATARRNLPPEKYESICKLKVDAATARRVLSEDDLKLTLKPKDWTMKVREATAEDRKRYAESVVDAFGRPILHAPDNVVHLHRNVA